LDVGWFLGNLLPDAGQGPAALILGTAVAGLGAAVWARRFLAREGLLGRARVLWVAVGLNALNTVLVTPRLKRPLHPNGSRVHLFWPGTHTALVLAGLYHGDLRPARRRAVLAAIAGVGMLGVLLGGKPRDLRGMVYDLAVIPLTYGAPIRLMDDLDAQANREAEVLAERAAAEVARSFAAGRAHVLSLVSDVIASMWTAHQRSEGGVDERLRAEGARRLVLAERRLAGLRGTPAAS
jgi:hypothetical protein